MHCYSSLSADSDDYNIMVVILQSIISDAVVRFKQPANVFCLWWIHSLFWQLWLSALSRYCKLLLTCSYDISLLSPADQY